MADFKTTDLSFPLKGIDLQWEFGDQPGLTTRLGKNVRAYEPSSDRARGGSRSGLVKFLATQTPAGANLIQHLEMIVDPQAPLLGLSFTEGDTTINDTSDGGRAVLDDGSTRKIRQGGSGYYTHPEAEQEEDQSDPGQIELVQSVITAHADSGDARDTVFTSEPTGGNLLVCVVATYGADIEPTVSSLALGGSYTQAGSYSQINEGGQELKVSLWYRIATSATGEQTVRVSPPSGTVHMTVALLEYKRNLVSGVLGGTSDNAVGDNSLPTSWSAGTVDVATESQLVVAAFCAAAATDTMTPGGSFTTVVSDGTAGDGNDIQLYVTHVIGVSTDQTPTGTPDGGGQDYCAVAASFKWQGF